MSAARDELSDWLLRPETRRLPVEDLLAKLCERLGQLGVPVWRASTSLRTLHPEVFVRNVTWRRDHGSIVSVMPREIIGAPQFTDSPVLAIHRGDPAMRRRLAGPNADLDFPICRELAAEGGTDYFIEPLDYTSGRSFVSWCTDAADGFSDQSLALLEAIRPMLATVLELGSAYFATRSLLEVYLGHNAAKEVLAGSVTRGAGKTMRAAIYYCDLRGFTSMADRRPPSEVIAVLDRYFEEVVGPVSEHGGEVLKFIGDAVLAVFPVTGDDDAGACNRALAAARMGLASSASLRLADHAPFEFGVALHLGDVSYGNIGARDRLDFTVIGAAVNEAVRVEALCKSLGTNLLLTDVFAATCTDTPLRCLGEQKLRGVDEAQQVFTLAG